MAEEPKITELYKGKVTVRFFPTSHQYWVSVNGEKFKRGTGVTTYCGIKDKSKPLQMWQQQITADYLLGKIELGEKVDIDMALEAVVQCDIRRDEAADIGKEIHGWCEQYIKHKMKLPGFESIPDIPNFPEAVTGVNSFFAWEKEHKVKYLASERVVYSMKHKYMGTMDLEAMIDGEHCAGDFKSSNGLYNGVRMQVAGYAEAVNEEAGKQLIKKRWAIRLSKYSEEEYHRREERKREMRKAIAKIMKREYKDYPIKPYQVFEAKPLDDQKTHLSRDFDAFLHAKALCEWDRETDAFYNGKDW